MKNKLHKKHENENQLQLNMQIFMFAAVAGMHEMQVSTWTNTTGRETTH